MVYIYRGLANLLLFLAKVKNKLLMAIFKPLFSNAGKNCVFSQSCSYFTYEFIQMGDDVFIGKNAFFSSAKEAEILIGNDVMIGPGVTILCGDHEIGQVGVTMTKATHDPKKNSKSVAICDDVWIGANSVLLKGIIVGEGAVVAAGSVVTKDVPEYVVVSGVPAKFMKNRFTDEDLKIHKIRNV